MKVLVVASGNSNTISPFVQDQINALINNGIEVEYFPIKGQGINGYLKNRKLLIQKIKEISPDLIHAHYGLSGLLANLQRRIPVITTYHGNDINDLFPHILSMFSIFLSRFNIFVSSKLASKAKIRNDYSIISCGVDLNNFQIIDKKESRNKMGLVLNKKYVLFSSAFSNKLKNYPLAAEAIKLLKFRGNNVELTELKGYSREEVNILMNAVDCILVTSHKESGPLVIKEAMAVSKCAISVDVGDVAEIFNNLDGYYLATKSPNDIADKIQSALSFSKHTKGRQRIIELGLDLETVAKKIIDVYQRVLK